MYYYDNKNKIITDQLPKNSIGPDGSIYIDFDKVQDVLILANHNYFFVRNDTPQQPSSLYVEDVNKRNIDIDYPYADITRVWVLNPNLSDL